MYSRGYRSPQRRRYISAHDAFHLEGEREFKRLIRAAHPDPSRPVW
jgi:hypothetical protein